MLISSELLTEPKRSWDKHKRFHWGFNPWGSSIMSDRYSTPAYTHFESGETICQLFDPPPDLRKRSPTLGVSLIGTRDDHAKHPTLIDPVTGEPVKWPRLGTTMEYLLHDHETGHVVRMGNLPKEALPDWCTDPASCFWPRNGAPPVGLPVQLCTPASRVEDKAHREHCRGLVASLRMAVEHDDALRPRHWHALPPEVRREAIVSGARSWAGAAYFLGPLGFARALEVSYWQELNPAEQYKLLNQGVGPKVSERDYLIGELVT